jgi:heptosyltransferase III
MNPKHIIISRTDNIGDVILTLPIAACLKRHFPNVVISFLARDYVKSIVDNCEYVDHFISWDQLDALPEKKAAQGLKKLGADTLLHIFPRKKIAKLAKKAKIKNRIGTTRRWYHYFTCNKRVNFTRSKSSLHEAQLNFKLLKGMGIDENLTLTDINGLMSLHHKNIQENLKQYLNPERFNLILHPLTNGNTREWPLSYFRELIHQLPSEKFHIIVTGAKNERAKLKTELIDKCPTVTDVTGKLSLDELLQLIQLSDGLVANSTGPVHIAAALGKPTLGLFPPAKTMNPDRWSPIGKHTHYLVADRLCDANFCSNETACPCMNAIDVEKVKSIIVQQWYSVYLDPLDLSD